MYIRLLPVQDISLACLKGNAASPVAKSQHPPFRFFGGKDLVRLRRWLRAFRRFLTSRMRKRLAACGRALLRHTIRCCGATNSRWGHQGSGKAEKGKKNRPIPNLDQDVYSKRRSIRGVTLSSMTQAKRKYTYLGPGNSKESIAINRFCIGRLVRS